jgi:hypothetical protein
MTKLVRRYVLLVHLHTAGTANLACHLYATTGNAMQRLKATIKNAELDVRALDVT